MAVETLVLDPGSSNPVTLGVSPFLLASLTIPPAKKLPQWATNADSDGSQLVRPPYYQNRECTFQVRIAAASMDLALAAIGTLEAKLQEAQNIEGGMAAAWTPQGSTKTLTLRVLMAEITDIPVDWNGWFQHLPLLTVAFTSKPFLYGTEVSVSPVTSTDPVVTVTVPGVTGDVAAEARVAVQDGSSQSRQWVELGLEQRFFDSGSPAPVLIDSEDLATSGFQGAQAARTGGYRRSGASHDVVSATLVGMPVVLCATGNLPHIGTWRVKARIWSASTDQFWRLVWQSGDGGWATNAYDSPKAAGSFSEIDLGIVTLNQAASGTQKWSGRIEAYTATGGGEIGEVDYLLLYPVEEGYVRIETPVSGPLSAASGYDYFTQSVGSALNGLTATIGGTWATSGATTDFVVRTPNGAVKRSTTSDGGTQPTSGRFAVLGSALSDMSVQVDFAWATGAPAAGVILRWVNSSNYFVAIWLWNGKAWQIFVYKVVSGSATLLAVSPQTFPSGETKTLRAQAQASGRWAVLVGDQATSLGVAASGSDPDLATGGALASGKAGIYDYNKPSIPSTRVYQNFSVSAGVDTQAVIYAGRLIEIRSDANLRLSADGASYGDMPSRGSRLFIPPTGDRGRVTRIVARAARNDLAVAADTPLGDSLTVTVSYTPRFLAVPR